MQHILYTASHLLSLLQIADIEAPVKAAAAKAARQKQLLDGPWEFERKIGENEPGKLNLPNGIGVSPNADIIAIADYSSNAHRVQVYNGELVHKYSLDTTQGLKAGTRSYPREVIVSSDGICYLTDETQFVKQYDVATGVYKGRWVAVSPQHKPSDAEDTCLSGLTMDTKGQLLVGEVRQKYISKHKVDGVHVASIKVDIKPWSLAVTSQDEIIISNCAGTVHIVDNTGQLLHTVKPPSHVQSWVPAGVACSEDIICICNYDAKGIHCYSVFGDYLRDIPISIPGDPKRLAITPDGKQLMVSNRGFFTHDAVAVYKFQAWTVA